MRKTIRTCVLTFSLIAALATSVSAAPAAGSDPFGFFERVKFIVVHMLDDAKLLIPPG